MHWTPNVHGFQIDIHPSRCKGLYDFSSIFKGFTMKYSMAYYVMYNCYQTYTYEIDKPNFIQNTVDFLGNCDIT